MFFVNVMLFFKHNTIVLLCFLDMVPWYYHVVWTFTSITIYLDKLPYYCCVLYGIMVLSCFFFFLDIYYSITMFVWKVCGYTSFSDVEVH